MDKLDKIKDITMIELAKFLHELVVNTAADIDQNLKDDKLEHVVARLIEILKYDYTELKVIQIENIFKGISMGLHGDTKVTVQNLIKLISSECKKDSQVSTDNEFMSSNDYLKGMCRAFKYSYKENPEYFQDKTPFLSMMLSGEEIPINKLPEEYRRKQS